MTTHHPSLPQSSVKHPKDLLKRQLLSPEQLEEVNAVAQQTPMLITPEMLNLMDADDESCAIRKQFVPQAEELTMALEERVDPIGDAVHTPVKGIVHRYPDRVLLKPMHQCPVYCRFCFRKEVIGPQSENLSEPELEAALDYIRQNQQIWEVIVTGGDPFIMSNAQIGYLVRALDAIDHVEVIRFHTRVPVVKPLRITQHFVQLLKANTAVYVVLHCNHPKELMDSAVKAACASLIDQGIPMLSQTVLLKGVNDDAETMTLLLRKLTAMRIKPYYLHHGDLAKGTGHFRTTIEAGQQLTSALRGAVSGLCQPTYVLDIPGGYGKVPISGSHITPDKGKNRYSVKDYQGNAHVYPPLSD